MSDTQTIDSANGFVALPNDVFKLGLTPGAFYVLSVLCKYADKGGFSWASLRQIGDLVGKSKAAVSGYVDELRKVGLVTTQRQTTANGFNYRLRFCVTFWREMRAKPAPQTRKKNERRVQPTERSSKEEIQIQKTQPVCSLIESALKDWTRCIDRTPYPNFALAPSPGLIATTRWHLSSFDARPVISAEITTALGNVWNDLDVDASGSDIATQCQRIAQAQLTSGELDQLAQLITEGWKPHWRRSPTPEQFETLLKSAVPRPVLAAKKLLNSYLKRWETVGKPLRPDSSCGLVSHNIQRAA